MLKPKSDIYIYLVDHSHDYTNSLKKSIDNQEKYNIETFTSGEKFIAHINDKNFLKSDICIVFLGYKYYDDGKNTLMNGLEILQATKALNSNIEVVMLTGHDEGSYGSSVMKSGAYSFIPKNENIHLRINNIIMGIISQKRLVQKRNSLAISLRLLIGFIIFILTAWVIFKVFY